MNKWNNENGAFFLTKEPNADKLPIAIYQVGMTQQGICLFQSESKFNFPYKLYDLDNKFIDRIEKTYKSTTGNLGVLLTGIKGTGKSVTSKLICNRLKMPVLVVTADIPNLSEYLSSIKQDVVIFIDEYEKIYEDSAALLSVMDGVLSNLGRKIFLLTCNSFQVHDALLSRPGRIRYHKQYNSLSINAISEILDDLLENKNHRSNILEFLKKCSVLTVDTVKSLIEEVNIHDELPDDFIDIFNVSLGNVIKHNVFIVKGKTEKLQYSEAKVSYSTFSDNLSGYDYYINNIYMGSINKVINSSTIQILKGGTKTVFRIEPVSYINPVFKEGIANKYEDSEEL